MGRVNGRPLQLEVVTDERAFRSLEPEWRDLFHRLPDRGYFQSFDWNRRCWEHIARIRGQRLFVVVGRRADNVVLIWPLARYRRMFVRTAEWIGGEHAYCHDVLVEDTPEAGDWLEAAWAYVTRRIDFMWLNHMRDDARVVSLLRRARGVAVNVEEAPYVDWSDWPDWEAYWRGRSRNLRGDVGRRRRRLAEQGEVAFRIATSAPEVEETLDWLFEHKAAWMKKRGLRMQDGGIDTPDTQAFYRAFATDALASDNLCLATLTLDGNILAADMGIVFERTFVYKVGAYDSAWERLAPAKVLMADLVRWTCDNDCTSFDFMPWGERYKYLWAPGDTHNSTYLVPCSRWGRILVGWRRSRLGSTLRALSRLRPADVSRILRNRLTKHLPRRRSKSGG